MSAIANLVEAAVTLGTWPIPLFIILGVLIGVFIGILPGIGPAIGIALLLPLTAVLEPVEAILFLTSMYCGGMYGGSVAAILLNAPGSVGSAATVLDGYPLTRQGRAMYALTIASVASSFGGLITAVGALLLIPVVIPIILMFGSVEYTLIAAIGIALISVVASGSMLKGIVAGTLGLLLSTIGSAPVSPDFRFVFGQLALYDGLSFVAVLIGLFAIGEILNLVREQASIGGDDVTLSGSRLEGLWFTLRNPVLTLKSSLIGFAIGAVPGSGASVSNFVSYTEAIRSSDDPDSFGNGNPEGVIAAEAANNGTVVGSLIPVLSFGIPGSGTSAVLLGALLLHGIQPGPDLFSANIELTYAIYLSLAVASLLVLLIGVGLVTKLSYLTKIDINYLVPIILILAVHGSLALRNNWLDIFTVATMGIVGFYMKEHNYSIIAFVLGIVLGPIAEENLFRSLTLGDGSLFIFVSSPLRIFLTLVIVALLFTPIWETLLSQVRRSSSG